MKFLNNSKNFWSKKFPFKNKKSHKYSRGQLIVVAGEKEMVGASENGGKKKKGSCDKEFLENVQKFENTSSGNVV